MSSTEKYVPIDIMAEHLCLKPNTLRTWVRMGFIPKSTYIKVGNTYRFSIPEVVAALKQDDPAEAELRQKKEAIAALPEYVDDVSDTADDDLSDLTQNITNFDDNEDL